MSNAPNSELSWSTFQEVDMRTATIVEVLPFAKARNPSYKVTLDCGELGIKRSSAQITARYSPEDLIGKQVIIVVNFPPKQIANMMSECLILGVVGDEEGVSVLTTLSGVKNGLRIA